MLYVEPINDPFGQPVLFQTHESRQGFVVRVYAILFAALVATGAQCYVVRQSLVICGVFHCFIDSFSLHIFGYSDQLTDFFFKNWPLLILFFITYLISFIALVCCQVVRRSFPINFLVFIVLVSVYFYLNRRKISALLLYIFQVESLTGMCVYITARYRNEILVYGFAITATVCLLISLLAIFGAV